jgi:hypothetical protein
MAHTYEANMLAVSKYEDRLTRADLTRLIVQNYSVYETVVVAERDDETTNTPTSSGTEASHMHTTNSHWNESSM